MLSRSADDFALLKWGYKRARELARRMPCYRGEYVPNHPEFSADSAALCQAEIKPAAFDAPDLVYTADDEKAIEAYTRKFGELWMEMSSADGYMTDISLQLRLPGIR